MHTAVALDEVKAVHAAVTDAELVVELEDGRTLHVPLDWFPRLAYGTRDERAVCRLIADGTGIHWLLLDEDISIEGLLSGRRSGESTASLEQWRTKLDARRAKRETGPWMEAQPLPAWWSKDEGS